MSPTTKRRILLTALVAAPLLCLACAGCAVNNEGWEMKPAHAPLPAYFVDGDFCEQLRYFDDELRPLTDPTADAFIASVKSWGPLKEKPAHIDLVDSVLAYIRGGSQ